MEKPLRALIIEDVASDIEILKHEIQRSGMPFTVQVAETKEEFITSLHSFSPDIILSDYSMPRFDGMKALQLRNVLAPMVPFILVTGSTNEEVAVECMKAGADDYVIKGSFSRLNQAISAAIEKKDVIRARQDTMKALQESEFRLQSIFRAAPTGIGLVKDRIFMDVNDRICEITGYTREELIGNSAGILYPSHEDYDFVGREKYRQIAETGTGTVETRWRRKDGEIIDILLASTPLNIKDLSYGVTFTALDISESKKLEAALQESENKYRTIFENIQDVFYQVDAGGRITEISPSIYKYSGWTREELIGKPVKEVYYTPDDRDTMLDELQKKGEVVDYDVQLRTRDGQIKWASLNIHVVIDLDGNPAGIEGSLRDVTQRKRMEEALKESEEKFRTLAETSPYAIMIYQDDYWVYTNPAGEDICGYKSEELYRMKFWEFVAEEDREKVMQNGKNRQQGRLGKSSYEMRIRTKQGQQKWVYLSGNVMSYQGRYAAIISVVDISDRKRAEEIRQVLYNISTATFLTIDVEGLIEIIRKELGKLIDTKNFFVAFYDEMTKMLHAPYWKDQYEKIENWPAEKSVTGIIVRNNKSLLLKKQDILDLRSKDEIRNVEPRSECWLGVPLKENDKAFGAFVVQSYDDPDAYSGKDVEMLEFVSHQISSSIHRKKAELDLYDAMEKAKESDRLKSAFLANMSHEIRTPMNAILGFSELLGQPDTTPDELERYSEIVQNAGKRLMHLIDDIIDLSKIEAKQIRIVPSVCNIYSLLTTTVESFRSMEILKRKPELKLVLNLPPAGTVPLVDSDPLRLQQVMDNLITNAIKYTENGSIEIGVTIRENEGSWYLEFYVKDTGKGIAPDKQKIIFERFRQIEENEYHEGAGLGLSIAKGVVELLGGSIWVESELGSGTTFRFLIPFVPAQQQKDTLKTASGRKPDFRGIKILIAEDDDDSYYFVYQLLKSTGAHLIRAVDGESLMKMIPENIPDILLLDINMPGKTGHTCLKEIRENNYSFKIIVQTAYAMEDEKKQCIAEGCDGYLAKPFKKSALFDSIIAVLPAEAI